MFLAFWGGQLYGEWLALSAAIGYLALLDLGMQTYVVNRMCQAYARGRLDELHRDLHSAIEIFAAVAVVGLAAVTAFVALAPVGRLFNLQRTSPHVAGLSLVLLGMNVVLNSIPMGLVGGLYRATGAYARGQMIGNGLRLVQFVVTAAVVWLWTSVATLAAGWVAMNTVGIVLILSDLRRFRPEVRLDLSAGSWRHGARLVGPALLFLLFGIASAMNLQGMVLVVNSFLGAVAVVQFVTIRTVANVVPQGIGIVNSALWPEITVVDARGERERLVRLSQWLVKANVSVAVLAALLIRFVGPDLYRLWTGRQVVFEPRVLDLFLIQVVLMAIWNASGLPLLAINRQHAYAWLMLVNSVVSIGLALALVRSFGLIGVALGSVLADVVCNLLVVPWLLSRALERPVVSFLLTSVAAPLIIGAVLLVLVEGAEPFLGASAWRLVGVPIVMIGFYGIATYRFSLDEQERRLIRGMPRRVRAGLP
ncbi:MAG: polysaccharide biosynthesis C-terminal domain-containing protein [Candidatus Rokubacteria bacterium]|nr:polysaccharide biosynthesis C-terminal domain-containing protein [Candidatus Rokubacteria bacterium]